MDLPASIRGLNEVADRYDGFILDLWGVLHDGDKPYPGAVECLRRLKAAGKRLVVLSNAPRRIAVATRRMAEIGVPPDLVDGVMTSGEDAWWHLRHRVDPWYARLGRACFHLGPERDTGMLDDLDIRPVPDVERAEFILNTGAHMDGDSARIYEPVLVRAAARGLPMICANPDLEVIHHGKRQVCAGRLAERYEELDGEVRWHGKPHRAVYEHCFEMLKTADRRRVLAVGDSFRTDVAGAVACGIDALFVSHGIHGEELAVQPGGLPDPALLRALMRRTGLKPTVMAPSFVW